MRVWHDDVVGGGARVGVQCEHQEAAKHGSRGLRGEKAGCGAGAMPAKVSVKTRPTVTAGLAKDVELVNQ